MKWVCSRKTIYFATYGLGEPSELSGYVDCEIGLIDDFRIIDVRVLPEFDAPSSPSENISAIFD